jgi:hypothetical protein
VAFSNQSATNVNRSGLGVEGSSALDSVAEVNRDPMDGGTSQAVPCEAKILIAKIECGCCACGGSGLSDPAAFRDLAVDWGATSEAEQRADSAASAKMRDRNLYPFSAEDIAIIADRWDRARALVEWPVTVGCRKIVALINEIADVDFYGALAMSRLNPPEPEPKRPRTRRRRRPKIPLGVDRPNLFLDFGVPLEPPPIKLDGRRHASSGEGELP